MISYFKKLLSPREKLVFFKSLYQYSLKRNGCRVPGVSQTYIEYKIAWSSKTKLPLFQIITTFNITISVNLNYTKSWVRKVEVSEN